MLHLKTRYLSVWEKLDVDWEILNDELRIFPKFICLKQKREIATVEFVLERSQISSYCDENQDDAVIVAVPKALLRCVNEYRKEHNVPEITKGSFNFINKSQFTNSDYLHVSLTFWIVDYCHYANKKCSIVEKNTILKPIQNIKKSWSCWLGFHDYDIIKDVPRCDDINRKTYLQKVLFRCQKCDIRKLFYHQLNVDQQDIKFLRLRSCDSEIEKQIDRLPWW